MTLQTLSSPQPDVPAPDRGTPSAPVAYTDQWIDGRWTQSDACAAVEVSDPATDRLIASVPAGTAYDADRAARAASAAFTRWAATPVAERAAVLRRVVAELERRAGRFAETLTAEVGAPVGMVRQAHVGLALGMAAHCAAVLDSFAFEERVGHSLVVRQPAGVAACITPWNVPLLLSVQKILPALAAGCTVVHKPSEITPLHARLLAEAMDAAGVPAGVYNMVVGEGPVVGAALAAHPAVDLVSLTGSTRAGRAVAALGAATVKRVHLELGGKNASLVLDDADLDTAVRATVDQAMFNTGQTCLQWSRLLVPRDRQQETLHIAAEAMRGYTTGDPRDPATDLGPLVSAAARERVARHIERGIDDGARLVLGGPGMPAGLTSGHYVRPTLFGDVDPRGVLAQEEIFGPVLCVIPYDTDCDALEIVNSTRYGLHGAVWSGNPARAERTARRFRTGLVDVNGGPFNPAAPFGGFKQSGIGRECGAAGLAGFLETQSLQLPPDGASEQVIGPRLRATDVPEGSDR